MSTWSIRGFASVDIWCLSNDPTRGLIQTHVPYHAPAPDWHLHSSTSCLTVQHRLGGLISLHDVATGKRRQFKRRASSIELTTQSGDIYWHDMIMKLNWISCECTQLFVNDFHLHIWDKVRSMWVIQYTYCWLSISRNPWQKARVCIFQRAADAVEIHLPGQWQVETLLPHDSKRIIANHLHFSTKQSQIKTILKSLKLHV